jgi:hypothetical protein
MKPKITFNTSGNSYSIKYPYFYISTPTGNTYANQPRPISTTTGQNYTINTTSNNLVNGVARTGITTGNTGGYTTSTTNIGGNTGVRFGSGVAGATTTNTYNVAGRQTTGGYVSGGSQIANLGYTTGAVSAYTPGVVRQTTALSGGSQVGGYAVNTGAVRNTGGMTTTTYNTSTTPGGIVYSQSPAHAVTTTQGIIYS